LPDLGGDPCHHFNLAVNIASGNGAVTNFIFSYWFNHFDLPALTDIYPPGTHIYIALFLKVFSKSFFIARLSVFIASLFTIYLGYRIGEKINGKITGLISAVFIAFNTTHIEHSVLVMTPVITLLALQLFVLFMLSSKKLHFSILSGISLGWAALCQNGAIILYPLAIIYFWILKISTKQKLVLVSFFSIFFLLTVIPWAYKTYIYFGSPLYTHMKYYPFINNFMDMMSSKTPPNNFEIINNINYVSYMKDLMYWFTMNLIRGLKYMTPLFMQPLAIFLPYFLYCALKRPSTRKNALFMLIMAIIIFVPFVIASSAMGGRLFPRHYILFLAFLPPLFAIGLEESYQNLKIKMPYLEIYFNKTRIILFVLLITGVTALYNEIKSSPWRQNNEKLYRIGDDIKKITEKDSVIMYAFTPQDAWCLTGRNTVSDPIFGFFNQPSIRAKEVVDKYNVKYLLVDQDDQIYKRSNIYFSEFLYNGLKLKKIYKSPDKEIVLYEIEK
jgi:4-amino-4-deoxy-L-arabinose transferase-like glycosyltransferase